jgi:hypothetical protein
MGTGRRGQVVVCCLVATASLSGCGSNRAADVQAVASRFYTAVADQNGGDACALLAPPTRSSVEQSEKKPCADAIMTAGIRPAADLRRVRVYGTMAQVTWAGDVTFLTRYGAGWRVLAAGCSVPPPSQRTAERYDCTVEAG